MSKKKTPNRRTFSEATIRELPIPDSGRVWYYDTKTAGLCVGITSAGGRSFYFYKWVAGRPSRTMLGRWPDISVKTARLAAVEAMGKAARGEDPHEAKRRARAAPTLKDAWEYYLEHHAKPRKRTWPEDERQWNCYLRDDWGGRRLNTIRRGDVATFHTKMGTDHGVYAANRCRSLLCKIFSVAIDVELFPGPNPVLGVKKFREESRDRFLDADELRRFFQSLDEEPREVVRDYLKLSLLIGARRGNMLTMRWEDIDRDTATWRIPRTKSGDPQVVPLSNAAREIIEQRWAGRRIGCPWVFPSTANNKSKTGHLTDPTLVFKDVLKRAGLENVRLHDLRRTLASWQAMLGTSELIIGKTLGHSAGSTATKVYARLQTDTIRESVEKATTAIMAAGQKKLPSADTEGNGDE